MKLVELMQARGWIAEGDRVFYQRYQKDGVAINLGVDAIYPFPGSQYPDGYRIVFEQRPKRRLKVEIVEGSPSNVGFSIDEKKLDKKIIEICAMISEKKTAYANMKKETAENKERAVEFAAEIGKMLPLYKVIPSSSNVATVKLPGGSILVTGNPNNTYCIVVDYSLIATEGELSKLVTTLAKFS